MCNPYTSIHMHACVILHRMGKMLATAWTDPCQNCFFRCLVTYIGSGTAEGGGRTVPNTIQL